MTRKPAVPDASIYTERADDESEAAAASKREKEYTPPIVRGGAYDEDGKLVHETTPEPDAHRMQKPER